MAVVHAQSHYFGMSPRVQRVSIDPAPHRLTASFRLCCRASSHQSGGRYAHVLHGDQQSAADAFHWSNATVIENYAASADGSVRGLVLAVDDAVIYADGRRVRHVQENRRWLDDYRAPGQAVAVRYDTHGASLDPENLGGPDSAIADRLFALATSPYEARSSSASLDAAIVELLVKRHFQNRGSSNGNELDCGATLATLGPGALCQVSQVLGRGFGSLFNSTVGLQSILEEGRPLLFLAVGCVGISAVRAALNWTPVLAHATAHPCSLVFLSDSGPSGAPYLVEWDNWREAGVQIQPVYLENWSLMKLGADVFHNMTAAQKAAHMMEMVGPALERALFEKEHGLVETLGGGLPTDAAVVMAGLPGDVAGHLTRRLTHAGVQSERLLVSDCEYP